MRQTWRDTALAMTVHAYTAIGAALGFLIVVAALSGDVARAFWLGLAAMVIDATDGTLARRFRVKVLTPWFDGALLDNIVDYLTYVFAPIVLLWATGRLPGGMLGEIVAIIPLIASGYQFCRTDAKTEDHFFLGFPSYWNVIAFYAIVAGWSTEALTLALLSLSILVFVPIKYLYPSRSLIYRKLTLVVSILWMVCYALITWRLPERDPWLIDISLIGVAYYIGVSLYVTLRKPRLRPAV